MESLLTDPPQQWRFVQGARAMIFDGDGDAIGEIGRLRESFDAQFN